MQSANRVPLPRERGVSGRVPRTPASGTSLITETGRKVVIAGRSGFLGHSLARPLAADSGTKVVTLSRNRPNEHGPWSFQVSDAGDLGGWPRVLEVATAPDPVSNAEFIRCLCEAIGVPAFAWMVRIGAPLFMRTKPELAIFGRSYVPRRLEDEGFEFKRPDLAPALGDLFAT